ncbi:hypothetical protein CLU79DRAFT_775369 [Phycomyces nitens]|nr:hypothetical protein CLU79DRAFT_775369 [Phycomyces nitens]
MDDRERRERSESPEEPWRPVKPIPASKLQAFTVGSNKKTPFQKRKEEAEMKKKQETEEAAKVYADFVASFEEPQDYILGTNNFIKSNTLLKGDKVVHTDTPSRYEPTTYSKPQVAPQPAMPSIQPQQHHIHNHNHNHTNHQSQPSSTTAKQPYKPMPFVKAGEGPKPKMRVPVLPQEDDDEEEDMIALKEAKAQKKRNLDTFLEEIKKGQEDRQDKLRSRHGKSTSSHVVTVSKGVGGSVAQEDHEPSVGSFDTGDSMTTNLYIGNINPSVDELMICQGFGKYGPIASVKIMWPRTTEEKERNRNCGFVSFMSRKDAEQALKHMDGKAFHDYAMNVGWGKAVPLPTQPIFVLNENKKPLPTGLPFNAQVANAQGGGTSQPRAEVKVVKPTNMQQVKIIHRVIERVLEHGQPIEAAIMEKEKESPKFRFLFDFNSEDHIYYRWKLYSMLQGDTKSQWRSEPFQMYKGGVWWVPPDVPFDDEGMNEMMLDSDDEEKESARENIPKGALGKIARQRLEMMLRQVSFQRGTIARTMAFAIDHADAADEVVEIVCKALVIPETPISTKLARLFLVSDILHNSSVHVPNAWKYRQSFEARLPPVFEHLNQVYRSMTARLKAEQVRRHISTVLGVWENWMVFPQHYIEKLNTLFMKKPSQGSEPAGIPDPSAHTTASQDFGSMSLASQGARLSPEPEQAIKTNIIAPEAPEIPPLLPMENVVLEPVNTKEATTTKVQEDDLDGEPIDGEPMEDDVDGEPMNDNQSQDGKDTASSALTHDISDMFA